MCEWKKYNSENLDFVIGFELVEWMSNVYAIEQCYYEMEIFEINLWYYMSWIILKLIINNIL